MGHGARQYKQSKQYTKTRQGRVILALTLEGYEKHRASCTFLVHPMGLIHSSSTLLEVILLVMLGMVSMISLTCIKRDLLARFPVEKI